MLKWRESEQRLSYLSKYNNNICSENIKIIYKLQWQRMNLSLYLLLSASRKNRAICILKKWLIWYLRLDLDTK